MSDQSNAGPRHRQRAAELRARAAKEMHTGIRHQLFEMAAEYERMAISADAFEGIKRCERRMTSADVLPFAPRSIGVGNYDAG